MGRFGLEGMLAMTERYIADSERHIEAQRFRITALERAGEATVSAEDVLRLLLEAKALHERHRDHLQRELMR
jgi:hypothetical protein